MDARYRGTARQPKPWKGRLHLVGLLRGATICEKQIATPPVNETHPSDRPSAVPGQYQTIRVGPSPQQARSGTPRLQVRSRTPSTASAIPYRPDLVMTSIRRRGNEVSHPCALLAPRGSPVTCLLVCPTLQCPGYPATRAGAAYSLDILRATGTSRGRSSLLHCRKSYPGEPTGTTPSANSTREAGAPAAADDHGAIGGPAGGVRDREDFLSMQSDSASREYQATGS